MRPGAHAGPDSGTANRCSEAGLVIFVRGAKLSRFELGSQFCRKLIQLCSL